MDQKDAHYGLDEREPLDTFWHVQQMLDRLNDVLVAGRYDFVFCLLPVPQTLGGHKAAMLTALRAVRNLKSANKPIVLGGGIGSKTELS